MRAAGIGAHASIGGRYQLINRLGHGGMGLVYRGLDRLTGQILTVKRLRLPTDDAAGTAIGTSGRVLLAQEFRLLASLRHPNIVSVLDYGFDDERQPFITMGLEENARTIIEAGRDEPLALQVDLLVQALRALAYLHRHAIIHCDLKPENILVVRNQVKVLDFGLSICGRLDGATVDFWGGTPAYMAPELFEGARPTERSDLFALGVVAYELFAGGRSFRTSDARQRTSFDAASAAKADIDPRLKPLLARLVAPWPEERYQRATDVIVALASLLDLPLSSETVATRESILRTAPLVDRKSEIGDLVESLRRLRGGSGGALLVGGESGVGKSRLLDEFAIRALIAPSPVMRGQALSQGGAPYHAWRDAVSNLVLRVDLDDSEAAVLKAIVPNISNLLGRDVADAPEVDPNAAQSRLMIAVEAIIRRQPEPVVVILEDLQWAGSESLKLWSWLARTAVADMPLLLVGSYRNDEAPGLAASLDATAVVSLRRLDSAEIAALGESLIGATAQKQALLALLEHETEGIPFFIIEVVRALAESAGELALIDDAELPSRVISGGMQKLVRRHLGRVASPDLPALETAAVIAREIDPDLMRSIDPDLDLEAWCQRLAATSVLELRGQQWRFAHDKFREQLLADLAASRSRELHRRVAESIERIYATSSEHVTALAHHWRQADDAGKEAVFARLAGFLALHSGACSEAIAYLDRALVLAKVDPKRDTAARRPSGGRARLRRFALDPNRLVAPESAAFRLATLEAGLTEAYYRLGDLKRCREHGEAALAHLGQHVPRGRTAWRVDTLREGIIRCLQAVLRVRSRDEARARLVADEVGGVLLRVTESFYFSVEAVPVVWSSLKLVNQCAPAAPSPMLAEGYVMLALLASAVPAPALAARWCRRASSIAEATGGGSVVASILSRTAVVHTALCRWDEATSAVDEGARIAEQVGDMRLWAECVGQRGLIGFYGGRFEDGLAAWRESFRLARRAGNAQIETWGLMGQGDALTRLGRIDEALGLYAEAIAKMNDQQSLRAEAICLFGMCALAHLRAGDEANALAHAESALERILVARPITYFVQHGLSATAEVFVRVLERRSTDQGRPDAALEARTRQALAALCTFSRRFPLGRPHSSLWLGLAEWRENRPQRALRLWRRSIAQAERVRTPYELGHAHLELGRHLPPGEDRNRHLERAREVFQQIGARRDMQRTLEELIAPRGI